MMLEVCLLRFEARYKRYLEMANGGISCVKYIVFICNILFALTGVLILTVGALVLSKYQHFSNFVGEHIWNAPVILIVVGISVFIIGFCGCCGAVKENSCMILTFSILIIIVFVAEIGVGIAGYIKHGELKGILQKEFNNTLENYNTRQDYQDGWKLIQGELSCCGINSPYDWNPVFNNTRKVPESCCNEIVTNETCNISNAHKEGCMQKLLDLLDSNTLILAGAGIAVALIQVMTIFYACCLYRSFRRNYETV